jgi:hypothetical protein
MLFLVKLLEWIVSIDLVLRVDAGCQRTLIGVVGQVFIRGCLRLILN